MYPCPIPVSNVSPKTHPTPRFFNFHWVFGTNPSFSSLNLSHAVIIVCQKIYEKLCIDLKSERAKQFKNDFAKKSELFGFYQILEEKLDESNFFLVKERKKITLQKIKNIFGKINLSSKEIKTLVAMLRNLTQ